MQESDEPSPVVGTTFEGMVDRALDAPEIAAALGAAGTGASREELRAEALEERARLVGVAAAEYSRYLALRAAAVDRYGPSDDGDQVSGGPAADGGRMPDGPADDEVRAPDGPVGDEVRAPDGPVGDGVRTSGDPAGDDDRTPGDPADDDVQALSEVPHSDPSDDGPTTPGDAPAVDGHTKKVILPVLAVLVPSLGAVATGVFLLCGFGLRALAVRPHIGDGLVMAGVIAAAVTAGAALGDLAWILVTGARSRSGRRPGHPADRDPEVCRARESWENAVLERGLVPFLRQRAESAGADPAYASEGYAVGAEDGTR
ncbi:hypothetical protein [Streptomyces gibsoniae]|uniref:DUF4190 domain-containing protein n=1 Tax=Streptomyces gibsoniae TaxID=3075529 RepID=A0ABU2UAC1_9ACTN|nr:hypothetical protein [Streptomyces sp. DSM 41699]MDT0470156.1 hypothetical protein [Streptomyces sp. DSM 41699]